MLKGVTCTKKVRNAKKGLIQGKKDEELARLGERTH